jgi:thioredoxin 1
MNMIRELTDEAFQGFVENEALAVVDFYATWCPPCDKLSPLLKEISDEYKDELVVGAINVDTNPQTVQKYGVMSMPTVVVFQQGEPISRLIGYRPKQTILNLLNLAAK